MQNASAPLGYRERVAQERRRIDGLMSASSPAVQAAWALVRHTQRFVLRTSDRLTAWDSRTKEKKFYIDVAGLSYSIDRPVVADVHIRGLSGLRTIITVGTTPVQLCGDVFIVLDAVEPLQAYPCPAARLIVYSGAAPVGKWAAGTAVGTQQEYLESIQD